MNRPPGRYKPDNSGLYRIDVNGKYGFMDRSGKTMITPQFDEAYGFSEGLAAVRVGTKFGYIDTKGVIAITPQFDQASAFRYGRAAVKLCCGPFFDGADSKVGRVGKNRYGFIDKDGKYVGTPSLLWVQSGFGGGFTLVRVDGGYGIMDRSGKVVIADKVEEVGWGGSGGFTAGLAPAAMGGKWGYIDTTGKWIIDPQFESAHDFADGLAQVTVGGRWGYIDQRGKFVVNPQYWSGHQFSEGYAGFSSDSKTWGFIDTTGRVVVPAKFGVDTPVVSTSCVGPFSEGLAPVFTEEGWGFIDPTGKMVVSPQFGSAGGFNSGLSEVTVDGKKAYVTKGGAFVVDPFPGTNARAERTRMATEAATRGRPDCMGALCAIATLEAGNFNVANRSRLEGDWVGTIGRLTIAVHGSIDWSGWCDRRQEIVLNAHQSD